MLCTSSFALLWTILGVGASSVSASTVGETPATSLTKTIGAVSRVEQGDRDLIYSEELSICNDSLYSLLLQSDPTITSCFQTDIQWDQGGILSATGATTFGTIQLFDTTLPNVVTAYAASYNGGANPGICQAFDSCVLTFSDDDFVSYPGQFTYDCSNVYCGPNTARECDGTYRATACPAGVSEASLPDIPLLRNVNCQVFEDALAETEFSGICGSCVEDAANELSGIQCNSRCVGCNDNNECIVLEDQTVFSELNRLDETCFSTFDDQVICIIKTGPAQLAAFADVRLFDCFASLNDNDCSCSICGIKEGVDQSLSLFSSSDLNYQVDCSNVDGSSTYNECTGAATGAFTSLVVDLDATKCQTQQQVPNVPMMPISVPVMAPTMLGTPPPQMLPVAAPVTAPPTIAPLIPAASPVIPPPSMLTTTPVAAPPVPIPSASPVVSTIGLPQTSSPNASPTSPESTPMAAPVSAANPVASNPVPPETPLTGLGQATRNDSAATACSSRSVIGVLLLIAIAAI